MEFESGTVNRHAPASGMEGPEANVESAADLCAFWASGMLLGLDVALVAEIVTVESMIGVPMSPSYVLGLFNLRGTPIALLDLSQVLGFSRSSQPPQRPRGPTNALVVRHEDTIAAFPVDRMHSVVSGRHSAKRYPSQDDHPAIASFITVGEAPSRTVTVLNASVVVERLSAARMRPGLVG